jgi:hypothetical protein
MGIIWQMEHAGNLHQHAILREYLFATPVENTTYIFILKNVLQNLTLWYE